MGSQYAYGESVPTSTPQQNMQYYAAPRGFTTVCQHLQAGQAVEHIPHRVFVGGFGAMTTEADLRVHFEKFFTVRDVKVIRSHEGISKGYGFVSFDTEEESNAVQEMVKQAPEKLELNGRRLNLGPALRKMVQPRYSSNGNGNTSNDYAMATPTGQVVPSPTMQYSYTYPTAPQQSPYMMGYPPTMGPPGLMLSPSQSMEESGIVSGQCNSNELYGVGDDNSQESSNGVQCTQNSRTSPNNSIYQQQQPQHTYYAQVPPNTPMTPTFRMYAFPPVYYGQSLPMNMDGSPSLYPQQMSSPPVGGGMIYGCGPTPYMTPPMDTRSFNMYTQQQHEQQMQQMMNYNHNINMNNHQMMMHNDKIDTSSLSVGVSSSSPNELSIGGSSHMNQSIDGGGTTMTNDRRAPRKSYASVVASANTNTTRNAAIPALMDLKTDSVRAVASLTSQMQSMAVEGAGDYGEGIVNEPMGADDVF